MVIAWTDAAGSVIHITEIGADAPAAGLTGRRWSAAGVKVGWLWDEAQEGFVPPVPVPQSVTMRQARLALLEMGLSGAVTAAIKAIPDPKQREAALVTWEYSAAVERDNPLIEMLGPALGLSGAALDDLFRLAATL
ncbi:MAG: hypothetical protein C0486_09950 [Erythrobacter sp.]|nr:hypothetical protein [Erythrobacter sp.]MBA4081471.1 hypothetical protein [Erythrobacter sp.]